MNILTHDKFGDEGFSEDSDLACELHLALRECRFNYGAVLFFAKFGINHLEEFLFERVACWNHNSLVTVLLYALDSW